MSALRDVGEFAVDRRDAEAGRSRLSNGTWPTSKRDDQAAAFLRLLFTGAACWVSLGFLPRPMVFAKAERAAA